MSVTNAMSLSSAGAGAIQDDGTGLKGNPAFLIHLNGSQWALFGVALLVVLIGYVLHNRYATEGGGIAFMAIGGMGAVVVMASGIVPF